MATDVSDKQLVANRRNARRSIKSGDACGPRTPKGKERARFNALKHGSLNPMPPEEPLIDEN